MARAAVATKVSTKGRRGRTPLRNPNWFTVPDKYKNSLTNPDGAKVGIGPQYYTFDPYRPVPDDWEEPWEND